MMFRRSSFRNNSSPPGSSLIFKRSTAAPKPVEVATTSPPPPPLQLLPHSQSTKYTGVGKHEYDPQKKPAIKFPVSPEADAILLGQGITNSNHPQHRMVHLNLPTPFICMGCKEYGAGFRYTCQQCNFELHDFCALAPPVLKAHPLHSQHQLLFNPKPGKGKGGLSRSKCDICGKTTKGYLFHCTACSFLLHPCCAMLSAKMKFPTHPAHSLVLLPVNSAAEFLCSECNKRKASGGKVYQCTECEYYLHAACAKRMVNGLHANGIKAAMDNEKTKTNVLGVAAKIASHVVVGFVGGLVEGIGEGLAEVLTQNFIKGRCNSGVGGSKVYRVHE